MEMLEMTFTHYWKLLPTITDEELLECVTFAVSNESERPEKFSNKKKSDISIFFIDKQQQKDNPFHL